MMTSYYVKVGWSYPSSPNAVKFGFSETGCWTVSEHVGIKPPIALAGFQDRPEAEVYKDAVLARNTEAESSL